MKTRTMAILCLSITSIGPVHAVTPISPTAILAGNSEGFGGSVSAIGDVNGDSFDDLAVADVSMLSIFLGGSNGIAPPCAQVLEMETFSHPFSAGADFNADGYSDVLAAATYPGELRLYSGSPSGLKTEAPITLGEAHGYQPQSSLGVGDFDGDGFADAVVGTPYRDGSVEWVGGAYIFYGGSDGLAPDRVTELTGSTSNEFLGYDVAGLGDLNGDGYDDLAVSSEAPESSVHIHYGSEQGIQPTPSIIVNSVGGGVWGQFSGADLNGDGYSDLVVGNPTASDPLGQVGIGGVWVFSGGANGISNVQTIYGEAANDYFGWSLAAVGDVSGDGFGDVLVMSWDYFAESPVAEVELYTGGLRGLSATPTYLMNGHPGSGTFGLGLTGGADFNGDSIPDFVIGDWGAIASENSQGAAYVYTAMRPLDADGDGLIVPTDCNDSKPGQGLVTVYMDGDGDGYGYSDWNTQACFVSSGYVTNGDDCDDADPSINPDAQDLKGDGIDQNCDGEDGTVPGCGSRRGPGNPLNLHALLLPLVLLGFRRARR